MEINDEKSQEYLKKETEYLRNTYFYYVKETRNLEIYSLMMVGGVWSWCVSNTVSASAFYLAWLAFIAINLFGVRSLGIYLQMRSIEEYLLKIESSYKIDSGMGWEQFNNSKRNRMVWAITSILFWTILSIATSVFPFLI